MSQIFTVNNTASDNSANDNVNDAMVLFFFFDSCRSHAEWDLPDSLTVYHTMDQTVCCKDANYREQ